MTDFTKVNGDIKVFNGRKRVQNFIVIYKEGKRQKVKVMNGDIADLSGYILPRSFDSLDDVGIDQCSKCDKYFTAGLDDCEHCGDKFCCDCSEEHRDDIADDYSTGGCRD